MADDLRLGLVLQGGVESTGKYTLTETDTATYKKDNPLAPAGNAEVGLGAVWANETGAGENRTGLYLTGEYSFGPKMITGYGPENVNNGTADLIEDFDADVIKAWQEMKVNTWTLGPRVSKIYDLKPGFGVGGTARLGVGSTVVQGSEVWAGNPVARLDFDGEGTNWQNPIVMEAELGAVVGPFSASLSFQPWMMTGQAKQQGGHGMIGGIAPVTMNRSSHFFAGVNLNVSELYRLAKNSNSSTSSDAAEAEDVATSLPPLNLTAPATEPTDSAAPAEDGGSEE